MNLSFLKSITVAEASQKVNKAGTSKTKFPENGADLRVYKNGEIYPSAELVKEYELEYGKKVLEANKAVPVGNGLDIIFSKDWAQVTADRDILFVGITPRKNGNIDIFGEVKYKEDGEPSVSVLAQGAATYGKDVLLPALKATYGIEPGEEGFIDLVIAREYPQTVSSGVYFIPKRISRGEKKDQNQFIKREKINVFPLLPKSIVDAPEEAEAEAEADTEAQHTPAGIQVSGPVLEHPSLS